MTLDVHRLSVRLDSTEALRALSLTASPGELVGLIGPNGAGKTTLLNAIGGLVPVGAGRIAFQGRALTGLSPDQVARARVTRTFQSPRLFTRMTVAENVRAGRPLDPDPWLRFVDLDGRASDLAAALTPGEARRLELARALAGNPALLLLDEPCGGLNAAEAETMATLIERAHGPRRITVLVEHKLGVIRRLCPRVVVLHLGEKIFDGPAGALRSDPRVLEAYLGKSRS
jgi:branched-chain amino acid transport system ATP-binding protein